MLRENYNWQRFWCPSTGKLLLTDEGYLSDPRSFNPDAQRLSVRIACRTAEWQTILETGLREHWGTEAVNLYEIAPLRRDDVAEAARAEELQAETFLRGISNREVVPLAAKPVTLRHLLRIYLENGQLPQTQRDLYAAGCRLVCEEINMSGSGLSPGTPE